jgi:phosphatidylglycerophosphatase C
MQIKLLSSKMKTKKNYVYGTLNGANCYGIEKVKRIKQHLNLKDYQHIYAYGDTEGDSAMLRLAHEKYYKHFN